VSDSRRFKVSCRLHLKGQVVQEHNFERKFLLLPHTSRKDNTALAGVHFMEQRTNDIKINLEGWTCIRLHAMSQYACVQVCRFIATLQIICKKNAKAIKRHE
jgi:hypothetical protein